MKKSLILISVALLLCACGEASSSSQTDLNSSSQEEISSSQIVVENEGMSLRMFGDLYPNTSRTIYLDVENYKGQEIYWSSSNEDVVSVSPRSGLTTECMLMCKGVGKVTILAQDSTDPSRKVAKQLVISEGEAMPSELFNQITGGVKLTSVDKCLSYDSNYVATVDEEIHLETIYEETNPNDDVDNTNDAYQLIAVNKTNNRSEKHLYVKGLGGYVSQEYIDYKNTVQSKKYLNEEGEGMKWDYSFYSNLFRNADVVTNEDFRTYDGGKTYHYASFYLSATYLCASMYLLDASPDDMYFVVKDNAISELRVDIDPYSSDVNQKKTGRQIVTTISEINTAKVEHLQPYERKDIHNTINEAINKMASLKNYQSRVVVDDPTSYDYYYDFIFTEDTIDIKSYTNNVLTSHTGVHKQSNDSYYTYNYEESTGKVTIDKMYNAVWESDTVKRYPTFDFASEIFEKVSGNKYGTIGGQNMFVAYCAYLSNLFSMATYNNKGYIELNSDNYISKITSTISVMGENINLTIDYSNYNNAVCEIDFSDVTLDNSLPTSFAQSDPALYNNLVEWGLDDVVPYLYSTVGYATSVFHQKTEDHKGVEFAFIKTAKEFDNETIRDEFIADYKDTLLANGYSLTSEKLTIEKGSVVHEFDLYERGQYKIAVSPEVNWNGNLKKSVTIYIVSDLLVAIS